MQCLDCMHDQPHLGFADGRVEPIEDRWERMIAGTPWVASCTVTVDSEEVETCSGPEAGDALSYAAFGDHGTREFFTHVRFHKHEDDKIVVHLLVELYARSVDEATEVLETAARGALADHLAGRGVAAARREPRRPRPLARPRTRGAMRRDIFEPEHADYRESVRRFIAKELVPNHEQWEADGIVDRRSSTRRPARASWRWPSPEEHGGGGCRRLPLQRGHRRGAPARRRQRRPASAWRCTTTSACPTSSRLPPTSSRRAGCRASAPGADHGHRDDRAGHRLRPRVDVDERDPRRRPLRRQRRPRRSSPTASTPTS